MFALSLSTPRASWVRSLEPIETKSTPSLQKLSISSAAAGVSTIIPNFIGKSIISFAFLNSSTLITKGSIIPILFKPCCWSLLRASVSHLKTSGSSRPLLTPCQPSIGFASSGSSSPPSSSLNSSVLASSVLYQTGLGKKAFAILPTPSTITCISSSGLVFAR